KRRLRSEGLRLARDNRLALTVTVVLHIVAAGIRVVAPWLLGRLVGAVQAGTTAGHVDQVALVLVAVVIAQAVATRAARLASYRMAERVLAAVREGFIGRVLGLPLGVVERVSSGDLLNRATGDIETLTRSVQLGAPEILVSVVRVLVTLVAAFIVAPLVALPMLVMVPPLALATRWYLKRAPAGYQREMRAYAGITGTVAETATGSRTVEALRLRGARVRRP